MPIRIEGLTQIIVWLIVGVVAATVVFFMATIQRRIGRRRYFEARDRARQRVRETVDPIFEKETDLESAVAIVNSFRSKAERQALEEAFFRHTHVAADLVISRRMFDRMGRIKSWGDIFRSRQNEPAGDSA